MRIQAGVQVVAAVAESAAKQLHAKDAVDKEDEETDLNDAEGLGFRV